MTGRRGCRLKSFYITVIECSHPPASITVFFIKKIDLMNKPTLSRCKKLLEDGFSIITVGENKRPNFAWKKFQTIPYTLEAFEKAFDYAGGKTYVDKSTGELVEVNASIGVGII